MNSGLRRFAETCTSAVRSAPEALLLLPVIALSAAGLTVVGTLPGQGRPLLGPVVEGALWTWLYLCLGVAYAAALPADRQSVRRVWRRLGLALLLALLSAHLSHLLTGSLWSPWVWGKLYYLKRLVPLAWAAVWCAALLPREMRALAHTVRASPALVPLPQLTMLLASSAILVSAADLAFEWSGGSAVQSALKLQVISQSAWARNVLLLFAAHAFAFAVTRRVRAALLLVTPVYVLFGVATLTKIRYMHSAVQPLDLLRVGEFLPFARAFLGAGFLAALAGVLALWIGVLVLVHRSGRCPMSAARRRILGLVSLTVLLGVPGAYFIEPAPWLWRDSRVDRSPGRMLLLRIARAAVGEDRDREFHETARQAGFLITFLSELPAAFIAPPPDYSPGAVAGILRRYCGPADGTGPARQPATGAHPSGVNLVLYLVESLMDPLDLGLHYTADPIPHLRALRKEHSGGYAIVPEEFGGSPSTEFETITGMSTAFLPEGSVAYRLYLRRPIPSLPGVLGSLGYTTTVVRADPRYFYNHETAFRLLGFDEVVWLHEAPEAERDPRVSWPSDEAVVRAVIQASLRAQPFFVLAFASSTHSPYNQGTYRNADLDVVDASNRDAAAEVKEYINALHVADRAIGTLVDHFSHRPDSTIIAVLGDHLPPLSDGPLHSFFGRASTVPESEVAWMRRRVPLLVWANFDLPPEEKELSTNALPSYLLDMMGIPLVNLFAVSDAVGRRLSIVRGYAKGTHGTTWSWRSLPADQRRLVDDYRLLQYDLLLGKRYALRDGVSPAQSCERPRPSSTAGHP